MTPDGAIHFWGKARPGPDGAPRRHPLVAHALDVAGVAVLLAQPVRDVPAQAVGFLVALHDIGKFSRPFQAMAPEHWPVAALGRFTPAPPGPKHDALGFHLLSRPLAALLDPALPRRVVGGHWIEGHRAALLRSLTGHHGRPPKDPGHADATIVCPACIAAAEEFAAAMAQIFQPTPLPAIRPDRSLHALAWRLAGLTTLADWIGSREAWFPYVSAEAVRDPAAYFWGHALPRAAAALAAAGMAAPRPAPWRGLRALFPKVDKPSPVQDWAERVALPPGPVLAMIEDLTGSGKTEAAMALAQRLLAAGRAAGIFLALPTMATANAMYGRLAEACHRFFAAEAHPSLALAHARAALDPRFRAAIPMERDVNAPRRADPADEPSEAHCAAWLAEDRRRALLAQIGVGTIDQALLAVLPVRHAALRLQGLSGKVLILDEVHAFDAYMRREMVALLEFHAALGGSAVLLSATLPRAIRRELVSAFARGLGQDEAAELTEQAYPLATLVAAGHCSETPCAPRDGLPRRVAVTRLPDAEAAMARIRAAWEAGAAVAWIRNTVDEAIAAAAALREAGVPALLFHARFAMVDRLEIEAEVLRRFGRESRGEARHGVLVATQVIEQSLDLDFDLLVTDLAPVDLLIQRAGRLWRHRRKEPRPVPGPELLVVSPEPVEAPPADWISSPQRGTALVYADHALLWRSARALFRRGELVTPQDMRPLIEDAFAGDIPPALSASADRVQGKDWASSLVAGQNVLDFASADDRQKGLWEVEDRTPTRHEEQEHVTLRLALLRDGAVVPYAQDDDIRRAWALSEVSVPRHRIASCAVPAGLEAAAEKAKQDWGRWERESDRIAIVIMKREPLSGRWCSLSTVASTPILGYSVCVGIQFPNPSG